MDIGLNPKDLRLDEQIAIEYTNSFIDDKKQYEKKNYHFLSEDIINAYNESKNNPELQSNVIRESNRVEGLDNSSRDSWER